MDSDSWLYVAAALIFTTLFGGIAYSNAESSKADAVVAVAAIEQGLVQNDAGRWVKPTN